jgi:hypothetical protein
VDPKAVARLEVGNAAELLTLEAVDDGAHGKERPRRQEGNDGGTRANYGSEPAQVIGATYRRPIRFGGQ